MSNSSVKDSKMAVMPVNKLMINMGIPMIISIPVAYFFSSIVISGLCGTWLVWMTFLIAEVLSLLVSIVFMNRVNKNKIMTMG